LREVRYIVVGGTAYGFDAQGEVAAAALVDGVPDWKNAWILDPRRDGGLVWYQALAGLLKKLEGL
jgi:hypothetical protein